MRWLRLYDDTINDPKILKLPEATRWHWIAMLCVASKNEGKLPPLDDTAILLRITPAKTTEVIAVLVKAGLIDKTETGFEPHNWNGRQYKSDVSTERVKRFRNAKRNAGGNVSCNTSETETKRPQITDTDTDSEAKASAPPAAPTREADLFRRGKEVLGKTAGGLISQLLTAKEKNVALARAAIEQASTKDNPREYINKIIRNQDPPRGEVIQYVDGRL